MEMRVCGVIVAGYPGTKVAYLIPMERMVKDIQRQLRCRVEMMDGEEIARMDGGL
jgi:hypothetical protein